MYRLVFRNQELGKSLLESGDPSIFTVSGELIEAGTAEGMSKWIMEEGGMEDDGVFLLPLDNRFLVVLGEHTPVPFSQGSIICVPEEDEIFIELEGIPAPEYSHFFTDHIEQFGSSGDEAPTIQ